MIKKLKFLLDLNDQRKLFLLLIGILILAILETVSVASILPFISIITDPEAFNKYPYLRGLATFFGVTEIKELTIYLGFSVILFFVSSCIFSAFIIWWTNNFVFYLGHKISIRVLGNYFLLPYVFFLENNSTELSKNIIIESRRVVNGVVLQVLTLLTRAVISFFIFLLLFITTPKVSLILVFALLGLYYLIFSIVRKKLLFIGVRSTTSNAGRFKLASEAIQSVGLVKLMGKSKIFIQRFAIPSEENANVNSLSRLYEVIPRFIIESIAFSVTILIIMYAIAVSGNVTNTIPLITLYVFAGYKLLPSAQVIYGAFTKINFNISALDVLVKDLSNLDDLKKKNKLTKPISFNQEICFKDVNYRYPGLKHDSIKSLNLTIEKNSTIGIIGHTGAGKSTLINVILGLLEINSGEVIIDGSVCENYNSGVWASNLGYVPQTVFLTDNTIASNIAFGIKESEVNFERVVEVAKLASIHDHIKSLELGYETIVGERGVSLSGGQQQRIGLARALYNNPSILILDEATSSLDHTTESKIIDSINKISGKITIIIIAHRNTTLRDCNIIYKVKNGEIVDSGSYQHFYPIVS